MGNLFYLSCSAEMCTLTQKRKLFRKGEYIAYQNSKVRHLLILMAGSVKTEMVSSSGLTLPMETLTAPYPLASAFLFADNNHFPVDVVALEDCEVVFISKASIEKQMVSCPEFMRGFLSFNANRMQYISERLKLYAQKGIKAKLAYYILSKEKDGAFELGKSVSSLADYFGVERPSLSRAISEMVRDGIIAFESGKGRILNSSAVENIIK